MLDLRYLNIFTVSNLLPFTLISIICLAGLLGCSTSDHKVLDFKSCWMWNSAQDSMTFCCTHTNKAFCDLKLSNIVIKGAS